MNRIRVALFNRRSQAEPLRQRLRDEGIPAEIHDELRLEKFWYVRKPSAGVRLEVPAYQFERAYGMLLDWDAADHSLREAIRCPECGSLRVDYPQFTRRSVIPNIVMGALAAVSAIPKEYYCVDCHFTWPHEGTKPSRERPNMAPHYFIEGIEQTAPSAIPSDSNTRGESRKGIAT